MSEGEMTKTDWSQQATRTSMSPLSVKRLSMQQREVTELPLAMGREGNSTTEGFSSSQRMWMLSVRDGRRERGRTCDLFGCSRDSHSRWACHTSRCR